MNLTISRKGALQSKLFQSMLIDDEDDKPAVIPIPNLNADTMRQVIRFCEYHAEDPMAEIQQPIRAVTMDKLVSAWDAEFINIEQQLVFDLILASNYLDIDPLLQLCCCKIASMIKGKRGEEIKATFDIVGDLTKEEDDLVKKEVGQYTEAQQMRVVGLHP